MCQNVNWALVVQPPSQLNWAKPLEIMPVTSCFLKMAQWEYEMKPMKINSPSIQWQVTGEGRGYSATWKEKKSRLVTGRINNSECSISKAEFYEAPVDKVTPVRENNSVSPSFKGGKELSSSNWIFYFSHSEFMGKKESREKKNIAHKVKMRSYKHQKDGKLHIDIVYQDWKTI